MRIDTGLIPYWFCIKYMQMLVCLIKINGEISASKITLMNTNNLKSVALLIMLTILMASCTQKEQEQSAGAAAVPSEYVPIASKNILDYTTAVQYSNDGYTKIRVNGVAYRDSLDYLTEDDLATFRNILNLATGSIPETHVKLLKITFKFDAAKNLLGLMYEPMWGVTADKPVPPARLCFNATNSNLYFSKVPGGVTTVHNYSALSGAYQSAFMVETGGTFRVGHYTNDSTSDVISVIYSLHELDTLINIQKVAGLANPKVILLNSAVYIKSANPPHEAFKHNVMLGTEASVAFFKKLRANPKSIDLEKDFSDKTMLLLSSNGKFADIAHLCPPNCQVICYH